MRKKLAPVLLVLGLLVMAYPTLSDAYRQWQLQRVLSSQQQLEAAAQEAFLALQNTFAAAEGEAAASEAMVADADTVAGNWPYPVLAASEAGQHLGVLQIPRINLTVPIYAGSTEAQLQEGVGQMIGTGHLGAIGNAALAGHRRFCFRHLDQLQTGDEIIVELEQQTLRYRVYKIQIVAPTDVSVLNRSRSHSLLTLITCHPLYTSRQRLVVQAQLLPAK